MSSSLKTIIPTLVILAGQVALTRAHDFINHWNVNGEDRVAFDPFSKGKLTAQRATNNAMLEWDEVDSPEVACGGVADSALVESWPLDAGSTVTVFWNNWPVHPGPVLEYMAYCGDTCQGVPSASLDWFKISEEGWTGSDWVSNDITNRPGHDRSFTIPADLAPGAYLVRQEILALHQRGKPQAYPVCFQAQLTGTGTARPPDTAKFPDAYNINDEFKTYNVFDMSQDHSQFIFPGPPVYEGGAGLGTAAPPASGGSALSAVVSPTATVAPSSAPSASGDEGYEGTAPSVAESSSVESAAAPPAASSPVAVPSSGETGPSEGSESSSRTTAKTKPTSCRTHKSPRDIRTTKDNPTTYATKIYDDCNQPGLDVSVVALCREQGGIVSGKTVTAEFASAGDVLSANNPIDLTRTTGYSSAGSVAAVADYQCHVAIGTQTIPSIIEPASFTGIFDYKPTWDSIDINGNLSTSPSLDMIGFFARCIPKLQLLARVYNIIPMAAPTSHSTIQECRFGFVKAD